MPYQISGSVTHIDMPCYGINIWNWVAVRNMVVVMSHDSAIVIVLHCCKLGFNDLVIVTGDLPRKVVLK